MFTIEQFQNIQGLGYQFSGHSGMQFVTFMNKQFPQFDLAELLNTVDHEFTKISTSYLKKGVTTSIPPQTLKFTIRNNQHVPSPNALILQRTFFVNGTTIEVSHDFFVLPKAHQGKGIAKIIFQKSLQQYKNMNLTKIHVHAGFDGGGYVWARHGFTANNRDQVDKILHDAKNRLTEPVFQTIKKIYDHYYTENENGIDFPMILWAGIEEMKDILSGSDWNGELALTNHEQMTNFSNYVNRP